MMEGLEYSRTFEHVKVYNKLICRIKEERHQERAQQEPYKEHPNQRDPYQGGSHPTVG
jgi:hypothetical protein